MARKKSFEEQAVQFAMAESTERVQSVLNTMKAILIERSPAKERKPRTLKAPEVKAVASGETKV